jgi:hypothetical protein
MLLVYEKSEVEEWKKVFLPTLYGWGSSICDIANIETEMHHFKNMFKKDAYSTTEILVPSTQEKAHNFRIQTNWHSYHTIQ